MICLVCALAAPAWNASRDKPGTQGRTTVVPQPFDEVRQHFTLGGKIVPPEVFRDLGDGDLADLKSSIIAIDLKAAIDSNLYADPITERDGWRVQKAASGEEEGYRFIGMSRSGLAVIVSFNGSGTGCFYSLHVLDIGLGRGLDDNGHVYQRVVLTELQSMPLGDHWQGKVEIDGDVARIETSGGSLAPGSSETRQVAIRRP